MASHDLFYFPYATLTGGQHPLLKVAALYFDKLVLLDPVGASWGCVGADDEGREAVQLLHDAGILEIVAPADVLADASEAMAAAIRLDMADSAFLDACDDHQHSTGKRSWMLALAKVPADVRAEDAMRFVLGDLARDVAHRTAYAAHDYIEHIEAINSLPGAERPIPYRVVERAADYETYREEGRTYDEQGEGYAGEVEYRYAEFPLALGESIMLNHAVFTGLRHAGATPITDDPFHSRMLRLMLSRAQQVPEVRKLLADQARVRQLKADHLADAVLHDQQLSLPILRPDLPLVEVLHYRADNADVLASAREQLGWMARRIEHEPWSDDFAHEIEHQTIPDVAQALENVRKARDSWLKSGRGKHALSATGIVAGAGAAVLAVVAAPLTPLALATAGLGLVAGSAVPGAQLFRDWRDGKDGAQKNGLHYLLGP